MSSIFKTVLFTTFFSNAVILSAQTEIHDNTSTTTQLTTTKPIQKLKESNFHVQLDLQTKYVWRGMEMMTEESTPVLFPQLAYSYKGAYLYAMGGYSLNGKYAEVDLGVSYNWQWLTIGISDYYYPTLNGKKDHYFDFQKHSTGHWLDASLTIAPPKIPLQLTVSNFFAGADKLPNGKQAYSTYAELSAWYNFLHHNRISLNVGATFNKSCYNDYAHGFGICNVEAKYTYTVHFKNQWTLPLHVAYIVNPVFEKSFVNFTASIGF